MPQTQSASLIALASPCLAVASFVILLVTLLSPTSISSIAQLTITSPSFQIWMGLLGSCMQNFSSEIQCTGNSFNPTYDFSLLPDYAPTFVLEEPPVLFRGLVWFTTILSAVIMPFAMIATAIFLDYSPFKHARNRNIYEKLILKATIYIGFTILAIGPVNYKLMNLYFRTVRRHFNEFMHPIDPEITVSVGRSPTYAYTGYILVSVPWLFASVFFYKVEEKGQQATRRNEPKPIDKRVEDKKVEDNKAGDKDDEEFTNKMLAFLLRSALKMPGGSK